MWAKAVRQSRSVAPSVVSVCARSRRYGRQADLLLDLIHGDRTRRSARGHAQPEANARICMRSEEHTSELQSRRDLVCRLLLEKKKKKKKETQPDKKKKKQKDKPNYNDHI